MKLKKILAGILSAAMVLTTVPFSGLGGLPVKAAGDEVTNIALASAGTTVKAYTGNYVLDDGRTQGDETYINDGTGDDQGNNDLKWVSGAPIKNGGSGGTPIEDSMAYFVLDLNEELGAEVESFVIRWHNMAVATAYQIQTSDTCDKDGDVTGGSTAAITNDDTGWETVADITNDGLTPYRKDEISGGQLRTTHLKRYVRLKFTAMNTGAGYDAPAIREFQIWGKKNVNITDGLVGYYTFDEATTGNPPATYVNTLSEDTEQRLNAAVNNESSVKTSDEGIGEGKSIVFDGGINSFSTQYLEIESAYQADGTASFSFWMKPSTSMSSIVPGVGSFNNGVGASILHDMETDESASKFPILMYRPYGNRRLGTRIDGSNHYDEVDVVELDEWYHVAVVNDAPGHKFYIYINGKKSPAGDLTISANYQYPNNKNKIRVGAHKSGNVNYNGLLDNLRIYDTLLSDEQVAAIYEEEKPSWTVTYGTADGSALSDKNITAAAGDSPVGSGSSVEHAASVTFSAEPAEGYVVKWYSEQAPAESVEPLATGNTYTTAVQKNLSVYARYELDLSALDAKIVEVQEKLSSSAYSEESKAALRTALTEVQSEKDSYTTSSQVTDAIGRLEAAIQALVSVVPITVVVDPFSGASVKIAAGEDGTEIQSGDRVELGTQVTLTPHPKDGLPFLGWFSDAAMTQQIEGTSTEAYQFTVEHEMTVYAKFTLPDHQVIVSSNDEGQGSVTVTKDGEVTGETSFAAGTALKIAAQPQDGYRFTEWKDENGRLVTRDKEFTATVTEALSYTAYFKETSEDLKNVARGKTVSLIGETTETDNPPSTSQLGRAVDGNRDHGQFMGFSNGNAYTASSAIQIDLGKVYDNIDYMKIFRYRNVYHGTVIVVSDDPSFNAEDAQDYTVVYNSDRKYEIAGFAPNEGNNLENVHGFGVGTEMPYEEDAANGHEIEIPEGVSGRYVTIYMRGNNTNTGNHICEVEVYVKPADTTELAAKVEEAEAKLSGSDHVESSKEALRTAVREAQELLDTVSDDEADLVFLTEKEVTDALNAIAEAEKALIERVTVTVVRVEENMGDVTITTGSGSPAATLQSGGKVDPGTTVTFTATADAAHGYKFVGWFESAESEEPIAGTSTAPYELQIDEDTTIYAKFAAVDRSALLQALTESEAYADPTGYTSDSWNTFEASKTNAETVRDTISSTQTEVDQAAERLREAIDALTADKEQLRNLLETYADTAAAQYTYKSWREFKESPALAKATSVNAKAKATPAEVSEAVEGLQTAAQSLRAYHKADATTVLSIGAQYKSREAGFIFDGTDPERPDGNYVQVKVNPDGDEIDPQDMTIVWKVKEEESGLTVQQIADYASKATLSVKPGAKGTVQAAVTTQDGTGHEDTYTAECAVTVGYEVQVGYVTGSSAAMGSTTIKRQYSEDVGETDGELLFPGEKAVLTADITDGYLFEGWYDAADGEHALGGDTGESLTYTVQEQDTNAVDGVLTFYAKFALDLSTLDTKIGEAQAALKAAQAEGGYTQDSIDALETAIQTATDAKETVQTPEDVADAVDALQKAMDGLQKEEIVPVTVTAKVNDSSMGSVTITAGGEDIQSGNTVDAGESVTFTAVPENGYKFIGWYEDESMETPIEGTTTEPYTVTADTDITVYAKFALDLDALDAAIEAAQAELKKSEGNGYYDSDSISALETAIEEAKALKESPDADPESVSEMASRLEETKLKELDFSEMEKVYAQLKQYNPENYTDKSNGSLKTWQDTVSRWLAMRETTPQKQGMIDANALLVNEAIKSGVLDKLVTRETQADDIYTVYVRVSKDAEPQVAQTGEYETKVVLNEADYREAADAEGKDFVGWEEDGKIVSTLPVYTFFIGGNVTLTPVYMDQEEPVKPEAAALLTNVTVSPNATAGKLNVKFVGQLAVPAGCKILETGLVWAQDIDDANDLSIELNEGGDTLIPSGASNVKKSAAKTLNRSYQFSHSLNGLAQGRSVSGRIYLCYQIGNGKPQVVVSDAFKVINSTGNASGASLLRVGR